MYRHFTCTCPRCVDPTELGSMMSAVRSSSLSEHFHFIIMSMLLTLILIIFIIHLIISGKDSNLQVRCSSCSPTNSTTTPPTNSSNSSTTNSTSCPGFLLPRAPTLVGGPWTCNTCKRTLGASAVQVFVDLLYLGWCIWYL